MKKILLIITMMLASIFALSEEVIVGTNAEYPPFEYKEDGVIKGLDADIIEILGQKTGITFKWADIEFNGLIPALQTKKIQMSIAGMSVTEQRAKAVNFSIPYLVSNASVVTSKKNPIKGLDDLEGKTYGAELGTTKEAVAKKIPGATVMSYSSNTAALMALKSGKIDGIVMDESVSLKYVENNKDDLIYVGALHGEPKAIAFNKEEKELLEKVNKALQEMIDDGTIEKLKEKYGLK